MGKVVSMTFRHNMSAILVSQSNLAMAEMEQYVTCHSKATKLSLSMCPLLAILALTLW